MKYQIFQKSGYESKHNMNCWSQEEYVGFGASAHSYVENKRYSNTDDIKEYIDAFMSTEEILKYKNEIGNILNEKKHIEAIKNNAISNNNRNNANNKASNNTSKNVRSIVTIHEKQNKFDKEKEYMMLGLRKIEGISIQKFKQKFIENPIYLFRKELDKLTQEELIEVDEDSIKLTAKGLDFANIVWEEFV